MLMLSKSDYTKCTGINKPLVTINMTYTIAEILRIWTSS